MLSSGHCFLDKTCTRLDLSESCNRRGGINEKLYKSFIFFPWGSHCLIVHASINNPSIVALGGTLVELPRSQKLIKKT